jgi:hypothetical protein
MNPIQNISRIRQFHMIRNQSLPQSARRRGQALLLAVVILVFAALLGTTFVAVVAINIGQTSRSEERNKAKIAAQAGLEFVNQQLTDSTQALKWRPDDIAIPPATTDPDYDFYWTPFDKAQGWNSAGYVKFPDPRSENPSVSAPNYMAKIEKILASDSDNTNGSKTGALRVSVIGFSTDDPNSFYKLTAYKAGPAQMPGTSAMRTVTNWDFANGVVPSGRVVSYSPGTPSSLVIDNITGQFPTAPFYITVGGYNYVSNATTTIRGQAVSSATAGPSSGQYTLTLPTSLQPTTGSVAVGDRVEIAAAIGAPSGANVSTGIDFNNDGAITAGYEQMVFNISSSSSPGSVLTNGGLLWYGANSSLNLNSSQNSGTPGTIRASGLYCSYSSSSPAFSSAVSVTGTASGNNSFTGTLATDSLTSFPGTFTGPGAAQASEVIDDGLNRILNNTDTTRQIKPFTPPDITSGGDGLGRYRELTKYSAPLNSGDPPQASAYGYGQGIYLNNYQDKERVYSGGFREMTQTELLSLWFSDKSTGVGSYCRRATPDSDTDTTKSLEEQHLRGWIAPAEFSPRGAFVQLNANGTITISLDPRQDGYTNPTTSISPNYGPSPYKSWHNPDGTLMGNDDGDSVTEDYEGGVYTQTLPWPANGVLFAEGNIRIGGLATNAPRSLTVVSMNNIYIEDSVGAGANKVLLMAKKNVVVNPTRVLAMPDNQTLLSAATTTGATTINVQDASGFRIGDCIKIDTNSANDPQGLITNISGNQITIDTPIGAAQSLPKIVRTVTDPVNSSGVPFTDYTTRLSRFNHVYQRRVNLPAGSTTARLDIRHSAENVAALRVTTHNWPTDTPLGKQLISARIINKPAAGTSGIILSTNKFARVDYDDTSGTGLNDKFPTSTPTTETLAQNYRVGETTDSNVAPDDDLMEDIMNPARHARPDWTYEATLQNNYGNASYVGAIPPAFFLASVGSRFPFGLSATPWSKDIFSATDYDIPMATSVIVDVNGAQATLTSDRYNADLYNNYGGSAVAGYEQVKQFGFSMTHGIGVDNDLNGIEDVLTTDSGFYNTGYNGSTGAGDNTYYTLDSRTLNSAQGGSNTIAFRFNPDAENYFDATSPPTPLPHMPFYRISRVKLEDAAFQLNGTSNDLSGLDPARTFDINAYVYAQQGSWYVIPGDYYDASSRVDTSTSRPSNVTLNYVNLPHNTSSSQDADENLDLDRDGVESNTEKAAVYRYHRYNYQINFNGALMMNKTPTIINAGVSGSDPIYGQVQNWTDKWATTYLTASDFSSNVVNSAALTYPTNFKTIQYAFDTSAAQGNLDSDTGWHPPISPDLMYQSG